MRFNRRLFAAACMLYVWSPSNAAAQLESTSGIYLKDLRAIGYVVSITSAPECSIREDQIRSELINRIVPAGLIIREGTSPYITIQSVSILSNEFSCAASINITLRSQEVINNPFLPYHSAVVLVWSDGSVITGSRSIFQNHLRNTVRDHLDSFLARWRSINAGADFVRQAPPPVVAAPIAPTAPNTRTVQQRLQALGLYQGAIDGVAGPGTRQAIQAFQRSQQMPATGDLDLETMRRLFP
jgi:hypothetical protein